MLSLELEQLEAELHHPGACCSRERLEQLLHPQFHEVGRSGRPYSRQTVIDYLVEHPGGSGVVATDYLVSELADGVALLTYQSHQPGVNGAQLLATYRSSLWRRSSRGWQLYYHQGTPAFTA